MKKALRQAFIFFAGSLVLLVGLGCSPPKTNSPTLDEKAIAEWRRHELVFKNALAGFQKNDEFDDACEFFEQLTGVKIHVNIFTIGVLPTQETREDFAKIQDWFRLHKHRLYWDESAEMVKVRAAK